MTPLVSIIIPVFNVERYLEACLNSVCQQTVTDVEVICVDDASIDNSLSLLDAAARQDPRVVILRHASNRGLPAARNTGFRAARSPWVLHVDSDDLVSKYLCERTLTAAENHKADAVFFGYTVFRDGKPAPADSFGMPAIPANRGALLSRPTFAWTKLVRADFLRAKSIEFPEGLCIEDIPVHWRIAIESDRPVLLDEPLVWYRQRAGSITYRTDWSVADSIMTCWDIIRTYLRATGSWEEWKAIFLAQELGSLAHTHAYYALANPTLARRVSEELHARMTSERWNFILQGKGLSRGQRDYLIACGRPTGPCSDPAPLLPTLRHRVRDPLRRLWHIPRQAFRA
jgi:glycosyltransferase involved in cell wall biosynthesis